jgi:probable F420-dependent oxidoreductase
LTAAQPPARTTFIGTHVFTRGPEATPESIRAAAELAESLGFDAVCLEDHVILPPNQRSAYPYMSGGAWPSTAVCFYEMLTTLAFIGGLTHRVRLMTHALILPYRNPVLTAKMLATLDQLSGGRLIAAVGIGWNEDEFRLLGSPHYARRGRVADEYLRMFRILWTSDDPEFEGEFASIRDASFCPKPLQKPRPPIWVGGWSDAALRRAAEFGDLWFPTGFRRRDGIEPGPAPTPNDLRQVRMPKLRQLTSDFGRSPDQVGVGFTTDVLFARRRQRHDDNWFVGSPDDIVDDLRRYQEVGVDNFVVTFPTKSNRQTREAMKRFAGEVMPAFS